MVAKTDRQAILLMGPTASGKTDVAISLCQALPCDIISVDSALVYRGMDIGTAKPDAETLRRAPHQLVDIREPEDAYSAGEFVKDAQAAITASLNNGRIPLLVGGTMMYFRALTQGLADLPAANDDLRQEIDQQAATKGWPALHEELQLIDPVVAARLNPKDSQRIQRALEVYRLTGKPLSYWQEAAKRGDGDIKYVKIALTVEPRSVLHQRIETRLDHMIENGFEAEMQTLYARPGLTADSTSMRSVGYRQFWQFLAGERSREEARDKALFATRQLAKRQLTWLRSETGLYSVNALEAGVVDAISAYLSEKVG